MISLINFTQVAYCQVMAERPTRSGWIFNRSAGQVTPDLSTLADQIDNENLMVFINVGADAGKPQIGHMKGGFVHDDRRHIRHGNQDNFHNFSIKVLDSYKPHNDNRCQYFLVRE